MKLAETKQEVQMLELNITIPGRPAAASRRRWPFSDVNAIAGARLDGGEPGAATTYGDERRQGTTMTATTAPTRIAATSAIRHGERANEARAGFGSACLFFGAIPVRQSWTRSTRR
jgi:hypothetical protein